MQQKAGSHKPGFLVYVRQGRAYVSAAITSSSDMALSLKKSKKGAK
ncbi:MAG TPA: hypothetical protein VHR27_02985 [Blastocatellia bacterium]|jgi:hypothetical protein|nr:hypothetical protein [Blastocatellia bacterium]